MSNTTPTLTDVLDALTRQARALGLSDSEWARRARLRKETLSRLRGRQNCDFATLEALAQVVGTQVGVVDRRMLASSPGDLFPEAMNRVYEEQLLELCASRDLDPQRWASCGPRYFMAGLAVMVASVEGFDRPRLLALAEQLHPGASEPAALARWLKESPVHLSRFLPMLEAMRVPRAA